MLRNTGKSHGLEPPPEPNDVPRMQQARRTGPGVARLDGPVEYLRARDECVPGAALAVGRRGQHRRGLRMEDIEERRAAKELVVTHKWKRSGGGHDGILGTFLGGIACSPRIAARTPR